MNTNPSPQRREEREGPQRKTILVFFSFAIFAPLRLCGEKKPCARLT
jgi:hypothetical protein